MRPQVLVPALAGAVCHRIAATALSARPPGGTSRWERTNYAGRSVSLLGGAATAAAAVAAPLLVTTRTARPHLAAAVAAAAGGVLGALDDLTEDAGTSRKGLRGHLGALARGHVTTGALKILGIGAGALAAAALLTTGGSRADRALRTLTGAALVAGTANLHNLFDLRPGRALKVATVLSGAVALTGGSPARLAGTTLGVALSALPDDLRERTMLGDTGANALGAVVGCALAAHPSAGVRTAALSGVVALTLLSERVSFSHVIATTPVLRQVDGWGRR